MTWRASPGTVAAHAAGKRKVSEGRGKDAPGNSLKQVESSSRRKRHSTGELEGSGWSRQKEERGETGVSVKGQTARARQGY